MNIRKTIIKTIVAMTLVAVIAPVSTSALTVDELQAQINALMSQLALLQGATTTTGSGSPAVCAGITFSRNMTTGATGSDVKCLQAVLNSNGFTVATTGAGSPGNETTYFGPRTLVAVRAFQGANGMTPANQVGPMTRAKLNAMLAGGTIIQPPPPVIVPTGAGLTVALASDNPASGTVVDGQGLFTLAKFVVTNGDSAEVKVTAFKVKRVGISADSTLGNVYLFEGAKRLTDGASVASTIINFNDTAGLFMVPANGSKVISVVADVDGAVGETIGLQLVASTDITSNASSVKGSYPITGNTFTLASGTNLATYYFSDTTTPSAASIEPQNDYALWTNTSVVGTRAVNLSRIAFRVGGSVNRQSDVKNFRLFIDGVQKGAAVAQADTNDYVTFDLTASPIKLETGSRVVKVLADIIGGSNKNVYLTLRTAADVTATDSQMNANLKITKGDTSTAFTAEDAGTQSISSGTLTITKMTASPSGDVVDAANNQVLAKFEFKAAGERVKIESLRVSATISGTDVGKLRNGAVYANGVQIGSTADILGDGETSPYYTTYNFGSSLIVEPGSPVTVEVRSDIYDNDGTNNIGANDTIRVNIEGGDLNNAYGMTSLATVDVPSSDVNANTLTVKQGGLTLSKYTAYTNQSMVPPLTNAKLGHFTLTANTTEAVNINTIEANLDNVMSSYISNLYVKFGNNTTTTKASVTGASNSWSVNYVLAAGQTVDVIVYGNISSTATGVGDTGIYVAGTTASSAASKTAGTTADYTSVQGQAITFTTGSFTPAVDGSTPLAQITAGGQQIVAGKFKFTTLYDTYTINELKFTASNSAAIESAVLKDGETVLATVPYDNTNSYFNITGLSVPVTANSTKVLTLAYNLSSALSSSTSTSQVDVQPTLDYVKYSNSQGTQTESDTDYVTSKAIYAFKSIPTVTKDTSVVSGSVTAGTPNLDLYGWKVAADAKGSIAVKQTKLSLSLSDTGDASTLYLYAFKLYKNGSDITSLVTITDEDGNDLETTTAASGANESSSTVIITWDTEDTIAAGTTATYKLAATASGFIATASKPGTDTASVSMPTDTSVNASTKKYLNASASPATSIVQLATSAGASGVDANFIWSDNSALSHTSTVSANTVTATSSGDWSNGYLVQSLPLSTNTFVGP